MADEATGRDAALSLELRAAAVLDTDPTRPAIEFEGQWHDWGAVGSLARAVDALISSSGMPNDAPVVLIGRNQPETLAAMLGLLAGRRTVQMIYPFQSPEALARDVRKVAPAAVVAAACDLSPQVIAATQDIGAAAIALQGMGASVVPGCECSAFAGASVGEPRIEILTSGTTGPPKRFPISYDMIAGHILGGVKTPGAIGGGADDPIPALLYMPVGNISGIYTVLPPLLGGRQMVLLDRFTLDGWRDFIVRFRPEASGIPPAMMRGLLDANIPAEDLSSIRFMGLGAAPLDPALQAAFEERYGIPILLSYGATEFGGPVTSMTPADIRQWGFAKRGSVGRALTGAQLRVVDAATGEPKPPGEEGMLDVVSPRIGPGWLRTADLAVIDADGFVYIRGRVDGAINRGGFKLMPETIEAAMLQHPAIGAVAAVGVPDQRLGEVPAIAIALKAGAQPLASTEAEAFARDRLPSTHIPVHWHFVDELPKTPSMKIDRPGVKRLFESISREAAA